ncbi:MAG: hypothetical protein NC187_04790 [Candidatus Amulumruptor caecigallinarius]|nr:hypothetical protein [Candidatus Amulumruptor caecigallinarius]MCM1396789.1 hypothetical protein [Candidatus Amulumruptor caecigallinarius]MCM1454516.1 hypothetical protein [bacterium]
MRHPLRHFMLRTAALTAGVIALLAVAYVATDPLKTLYWYPQYNADREEINAGVVTLANYDHYAPEERFDALIIGSSLSQYCYIADWREMLGADAFRSAYHLSSSSQTVFTANRFLAHALQRGDTLRHILVAFDVYALSDSTALFHEYYDTDPPGLHTGLRRVAIHMFHGSYAMTKGALTGWAARALTGRFPEQETGYPRSFEPVDYDPRHNEIYWTKTEAWLDTVDYATLARVGVREERARRRRLHTEHDMLGPDNGHVVAELHQLRRLLDLSGAQWKVVIMPNMTGTMLTQSDDSVLRQALGSGYCRMDTAVTELLRNPRNLLDGAHPRPAVMREILRRVYSQGQ